MMKINNVELEMIVTRRSQYPTNHQKEFLLVGRSNVGKSSFINTLLNRKNLAHTSSRPGKTQTLNFYHINDDFYLIDVPGYGYAEVSKTIQAKFGKMMEEYLETRDELKRVFMLVDLRHKPTEDDIMMYNFLKYYQIPVTIVATKSDKVGSSKREKSKKQLIETLDLVVGDNIIVFSSVTKEGKDEVLKQIDELLVDTI